MLPLALAANFSGSGQQYKRQRSKPMGNWIFGAASGKGEASEHETLGFYQKVVATGTEVVTTWLIWKKLDFEITD